MSGAASAFLLPLRLYVFGLTFLVGVADTTQGRNQRFNSTHVLKTTLILIISQKTHHIIPIFQHNMVIVYQFSTWSCLYVLGVTLYVEKVTQMARESTPWSDMGKVLSQNITNSLVSHCKSPVKSLQGLSHSQSSQVKSWVQASQVPK